MTKRWRGGASIAISDSCIDRMTFKYRFAAGQSAISSIYCIGLDIMPNAVSYIRISPGSNFIRADDVIETLSVGDEGVAS